MQNYNQLPASFRDPSGFLFTFNGQIYRQVNLIYKDSFEQLMNSGLYDELTSAGLLVEHEEVDLQIENAYKIIKPKLIPFISYPYEWCFTQLKEAALTTLKIQKIALNYNMTLKDSSAYNIQFYKGKPLLIDTLSFDKFIEGEPWVAYRQFCQHFLAPLALMCFRDIRLNQLLRIYIDGIPLDLASTLLPSKSWLKFSLFSHIHMHAATQRKYENKPVNRKINKMSRNGLLGILDNLESTVKSLKWLPYGTEWANYYNETNYSKQGTSSKKQFINECLTEVNPTLVWDIGANTGLYSRLASGKNIPTISFDIDPAAVEKNYLSVLEDGEDKILPLLLDLTNPIPGIGWDNKERMSLIERAPVDTVFALALIHHLAISNNLPLEKIACFFRKLCKHLIIEFVPKSDSQVQRLLATREDIFDDYNQSFFEIIFGKYFTIRRCARVDDSERIMYLMESKELPKF